MAGGGGSGSARHHATARATGSGAVRKVEAAEREHSEVGDEDEGGAAERGAILASSGSKT